jgi:hypothetical protein
MLAHVSEPLTRKRRLQIFTALVAAQDQGLEVGMSRQDIAERFGISPADVLEIEQEGLDKDWPLA